MFKRKVVAEIELLVFYAMNGHLTIVCTVISLFAIHSVTCFQITPRIINGLDSQRGQFPFFAFLDISINNTNVHTCGGKIKLLVFIFEKQSCIS